MKNMLLLLLVCCLGCARQSSSSFVLRGEIEGCKYGKAFLWTTDEEPRLVASADMEGGKFELRGDSLVPARYTLQINRSRNLFFLDGREMVISGEFGALKKENLKGSPANDMEVAYEKVTEQISGKQGKAFTAARKAREAGNQELADEKMTEAFKVDEEKFRLTKEFVAQHPDNVFSAYIADVVKRDSYEKAKALYDLLTEENRQSVYGIALGKAVEHLALTALNQPCPNFEAVDMDGKTVMWNDLKGHITVVDFWASWCGPCRMEMKNLQKQYLQFKDKGVRFVSVSFDDYEENWKKASAEEQIPWINLRDKNGWMKSENKKLFGVQTIPFIILIDKEGNIVAKNIRRNALRDKIVELLAK